jgi:hypothetical protein
VVGVPDGVLLPSGSNADVRQAERPFDGCPFADIIALDRMANVLQQVTQNERADSPVPGQEKEQEQAGHGQRDPEQMYREVERVAVPLAPIAQRSAQKTQDRIASFVRLQGHNLPERQKPSKLGLNQRASLPAGTV